MAQTGYTPISLYYSSTASAAPTAGNLVAGELAINTADGKLFYKDSAGVVQVIGTKGGVGSSTTTQVLYNSSGLVVGSANMVFDGTTLTTTAATVYSAGASSLLTIGGNAASTVPEIRFKQNSATRYNFQIGIGVQVNDAFTITPSTAIGGTTFTTPTLTADSSGNVGIGVTPKTWSQGKAIEVGNNGTALWNSSTQDNNSLICNAYYNNGFLFAGTGYASRYQQNSGAHIWQSSTASGTVGNALTFTQVLGVDLGKTLTLQGGTQTSGAGIAFPATQSASSDANCLDDYEEGTFTPTWLGSTTNPTVSGMAQLAYTKIGRLVTITGDMYATSVSGGSGNLSIGNLPFTSATGNNGYGGVGLGPTNAWNSTGAPTRGVVTASSTAFQLFTNNSSDARSNALTACTVANSSLQAYSEIYLCFSYFTS